MDYKWIGAVLITVTCSSFGISASISHRKEEAMLEQMVHILLYLESQLQFQLTPLPDLCRQAAAQTEGQLRSFFLCLSDELSAQSSPEVTGCIQTALSRHEKLPIHTRQAIQNLGKTLGRFDLDGQLRGLVHVRQTCNRELEKLRLNKQERLRSYQTLGFCAGTAIAVLFL